MRLGDKDFMIDHHTHQEMAGGGFFVTGGTIIPGAGSYLRRYADETLFESLVSGEFCYVLDARQLGKSSLMAHVATRVRDEGIVVISLDLTSIGLNLEINDWYFGLVYQVSLQLDWMPDPDEFWAAHQNLSPFQRWMAFLSEEVLPNEPRNIVVFVDEIDTIRSLPFSVDEFFAGIRRCYTSRATDDELKRLTFCLLGVATPAGLISNPKTTPFNIGRRISLEDFKRSEIEPLAQGFAVSKHEADALLDRIHYWTDGHPYLTQRLCREVSEHLAKPRGPKKAGALVDELCATIFFTLEGREHEDNLLFVRDRLLKSEMNPAMLKLYLKAWQHELRRSDLTPSGPSAELLLTGAVKVLEGSVAVRNRIYRTVFDLTWSKNHMPEAEARLQRRAYLRGIFRTAAILGSLMVILLVAGIGALKEASIARDNEERANAANAALRHQLFLSGLQTAAYLLADRPPHTVEAARALLDNDLPENHTFLWNYLWRRIDPAISKTSFGIPIEKLYGIFPTAGKILASVHGSLAIAPLSTARTYQTIAADAKTIRQASLSPDGKTVAIVRELPSDGGQTVSQTTIIQVDSPGITASFMDVKHVRSLSYSEDSKYLAIAGGQELLGKVDGVEQWSGAVQVIDAGTQQTMWEREYDRQARFTAFDSGRLWIAHDQSIAVVRNLGTGTGYKEVAKLPDFVRELQMARGSTTLLVGYGANQVGWLDTGDWNFHGLGGIGAGAIDFLRGIPNTDSFVAGSESGWAIAGDLRTGKTLGEIATEGPTREAAISDRDWALSGDGSVLFKYSQGLLETFKTLPNVDVAQLEAPLPHPRLDDHSRSVTKTTVCFVGSDSLLSLSTLRGLRLWDLKDGRARSVKERVSAIAASRNGRVYVAPTTGGVRVLDPATGRVLSCPIAINGPCTDIQVSENGTALIVQTPDRQAALYDTANGDQICDAASVLAAAVSPDGRKLCVIQAPFGAGTSDSALIWSSETGWKQYGVRSVSGVRFFGNDPVLFGNEIVRLVSTPSGVRQEKVLGAAYSAQIIKAAMLPPDGTLIAASYTGDISALDGESGKLIFSLPGNVPTSGRSYPEVSSIDVSADQSMAAAGTTDGAIYLWRGMRPSDEAGYLRKLREHASGNI